jgi:hypothetical protein
MFNVKRRYFIFGRLKSWYLIVDTSTFSPIWRLSVVTIYFVPPNDPRMHCVSVISFGKRLIQILKNYLAAAGINLGWSNHILSQIQISYLGRICLSRTPVRVWFQDPFYCFVTWALSWFPRNIFLFLGSTKHYFMHFGMSYDNPKATDLVYFMS